MAKESVIGPSRLPEGVSVSIVPGRIKQAFDVAISPEGKALGEDEAAYAIAKMVTTDFGYDLKVKILKRYTHDSLLCRGELAADLPNKNEAFF